MSVQKLRAKLDILESDIGVKETAIQATRMQTTNMAMASHFKADEISEKEKLVANKVEALRVGPYDAHQGTVSQNHPKHTFPDIPLKLVLN